MARTCGAAHTDADPARPMRAPCASPRQHAPGRAAHPHSLARHTHCAAAASTAVNAGVPLQHWPGRWGRWRQLSARPTGAVAAVGRPFTSAALAAEAGERTRARALLTRGLAFQQLLPSLLPEVITTRARSASSSSASPPVRWAAQTRSDIMGRRRARSSAQPPHPPRRAGQRSSDGRSSGSSWMRRRKLGSTRWSSWAGWSSPSRPWRSSGSPSLYVRRAPVVHSACVCHLCLQRAR